MSHNDSALILLRSTANFVHRRITLPKGKEAYRDCMRRCIELVTAYDLDTAQFYISEYTTAHNFLYPKRFFNNREEEIKYHRLACSNALDVLRSIRSRFIDGGSTSPKIEGGIYYEDESIF